MDLYQHDTFQNDPSLYKSFTRPDISYKTPSLSLLKELLLFQWHKLKNFILRMQEKTAKTDGYISNVIFIRFLLLNPRGGAR